MERSNSSSPPDPCSQQLLDHGWSGLWWHHEEICGAAPHGPPHWQILHKIRQVHTPGEQLRQPHHRHSNGPTTDHSHGRHWHDQQVRHQIQTPSKTRKNMEERQDLVSSRPKSNFRRGKSSRRRARVPSQHDQGPICQKRHPRWSSRGDSRRDEGIIWDARQQSRCLLCIWGQTNNRLPADFF